MYRNIIIHESSGQIRAMAREVLKGHWLEIVIGVFIYNFLASGVQGLLEIIPVFNYTYYNELLGYNVSLSGTGGLYNLLTNGAFSLGLAAYLLTFMRRREENKELLFYGLMNFVPAMVLGLLISLFTGLWTMLFIIPGIIATYRYSQAFYIKFDNPNLGARDCINASKVMTNGNKGTIFITNLSFIGWWILASLIQSTFNTSVTTGVLSINPLVNWLINLILSIPQVVVLAYSETANVVMYEIMSGHLYRAIPQGPGFMNPGFSQNGYVDPNRYNGPNDPNGGF